MTPLPFYRSLSQDVVRNHEIQICRLKQSIAQSNIVQSNKMEDRMSLERLKSFNRLKADLQDEFGNNDKFTGIMARLSWFMFL